MIYYWRVYRKYIIIAVSVLLLICGIIYKNTIYDTQVVLVEESIDTQQKKEEPDKEETTEAMITVYVCGSVKSPSNVTLLADSRVEDAVKLAGGLLADADLNAINMAMKLNDADMIYVPKKGEVVGGGEKVSAVSSVLTSKAGSSNSAARGKLNINKATAAELDTLPGIGPSTAEKIIEYRSSKGSFNSIEELNDVSGIGDKKFEDIKDLITVN